MKFKKTITLAILAAVLSANLASCVAKRDPKDNTDEVYTTDANGNPSLPINPTNDPSKDNFETVSKTVYASQKSDLQKVGNTSEKVSVEAATELTVTAQSKTWYKVSYGGVEYFIARGRTTEDDLGEKTFVSCDKTMYVNAEGVNVRPYPSLGNFSDPISTKSAGDAVKVIKESSSTGWSKVEITESGKTKQGFIKSKFLSSNPSGSADWKEKFTSFASPKTVYVIAESQLNLRQTPFLPDEAGEGGGIIVGGKGVPRGTELIATAEGTVDGVVWYQVKYQPSPSDPVVVCYGTKSNLSETKPSDAVDPAELIRQYNFTRFDSEITAYPVDSSINIRTLPSGKGNADTLVATVVKGEKVYAVAYGKSTTSDYLWCLVRLQNGKYGFASYEYLTTNADGKKSPLPLTLDAMIKNYGLTQMSETKKSKHETKLWSSPDGSATPVLTKAAGTSFEVVAKGTVGDNAWYLVKVDGVYYFALQSAIG